MSFDHRAEPAKTISWNHGVSNQTEQLQAALGDRYKVVSQWDTLQAIGSHYGPELWNNGITADQTHHSHEQQG